MGIHPFLAYDAKDEAITQARREMWIWAEPVIADCAAACYAGQIADTFAAGLLVRKQGRVWRKLIQDQPEEATLATEDLRRAARSVGLGADAVEHVDAVIAEELIDIVLCRFRSSPRAAKALSMVLIAAASKLATCRMAA